MNLLAYVLVITFFLIVDVRQGFAIEPVPQTSNKDYNCEAAREFITTIEFLKDSKYLNISTAETRKIATQVSAGCTDAAKRFIKTFKLLVKSHLDSKSAVEIATDMAAEDNARAEAFLLIFSRAYLKEYLDLDLNSAIKLARSLSIDFNGDPEHAKEDFLKLMAFCFEGKTFPLPLKQCGDFAVRITKLGEIYKEPVAEAFISAFFYLKSQDGPNISAVEAIKLAEHLVMISPKATTNFEAIYNYAVSKNGFKLNRDDAINFAKKIAANTVKDASPQDAALKAQPK